MINTKIGRWRWPIFKLVVALTLLSYPYLFAPHIASPVAQNGVLDARSWDFNQQPPLELIGQWHFTWRQFVDPKTAPVATHLMKLPAVWNDFIYDGQLLPGQGYASYQLSILVAPEQPPLGLYLPDFFGAGTLWLNGKIIAEIGTPAQQKAAEIPIDTYLVLALPEGITRYNLTFHISSFHHRFGGLYSPLKVGDLNTLQRSNSLRIYTSLAFIGGALTLALFLFGVYVSRTSNRSYLFAALVLFCIALRSFGVEKIWMNVDPTASADWMLRFEYYGWIGGASAFLLYIHSLFPKQSMPVFVRLVSLLALLSLLLITLLESELYCYLRELWQPLTLIIIACEWMITTRAERHRLPGSRIAGVVMTLIVVPVLHDILLYAGLYPDTYWGSMGHYILFALAPSAATILVFRINATTRREARLTRKLRSINSDLQHRVKQRTQELANKVDELDALNKEAEKARVAAENAKQKRSEFLGLMAHEIRTPLSGIQGSLDLALNNLQASQNKLLLENARYSTAALLDIVNDGLDLTSIDAGRFELRPSSFFLLRWLEHIRESMALPIQDKGLQFHIQIQNFSSTPSEQLVINADGGRLRQVLINLLNNACKFTSAGHITLELEVLREQKTDSAEQAFSLKFSVKDTGAGIALEDMKYIFMRYHKAGEPDSQGAGLGLHVSDQIVKTMGGSLDVSSKVGSGSNFHFEIIVSEGKLAPLRIGPKDPIAPPRVTRQLTLLVVEDDKTNRDVLVTMLQHQGHQVVSAEDGFEALQLCPTLAFDAVFTDIRLPKMSGLELACKLRSVVNKAITVVAVTANTSELDLAGYYSSGIDCVLPKPVSHNKLCQLLEQIAAGETLTYFEKFDAIQQHSSAVFDDQNLRVLQQALGHEEFISRLARFRAERLLFSTLMQQSFSKGDWHYLSPQCHKQIGQCGYQGLSGLAVFLKQLQQAAESKNTTLVNQLMSRLQQEVQQADAILDDWLASNLIKPMSF